MSTIPCLNDYKCVSMLSSNKHNVMSLETVAR